MSYLNQKRKITWNMLNVVFAGSSFPDQRIKFVIFTMDGPTTIKPYKHRFIWRCEAFSRNTKSHTKCSVASVFKQREGFLRWHDLQIAHFQKCHGVCLGSFSCPLGYTIITVKHVLSECIIKVKHILSDDLSGKPTWPQLYMMKFGMSRYTYTNDLLYSRLSALTDLLSNFKM